MTHHLDRRVLDHFQADAHRFDAIYGGRKGPIARFIDDIWRGVVRRRFELTLEVLAPFEGRSLLDVGCGSGRYPIAYAERGAARAVGIDFAPAMIELAKENALKAGVADRCQFIVGRFPEDAPEGPFDACSAMGFFDYVADPVPLIIRMRKLTRSTIVMSFPKSREWRAPFRRLRFSLMNCPLFLYSKDRVEEILQAAGINKYDWIELDRDYIIVAHF
jgi:2-polyprenyl-3-methyl-5-hydroxy-6-metoxy-1,4-benzoquinol methylase